MDADVKLMITEALLPVQRKLAEIELLVDALELDYRSDTMILSRQKLAEKLGCSLRFIQNNSDLKSIERRMGSRIFYDWNDVKQIIKSKNKVGV